MRWCLLLACLLLGGCRPASRALKVWVETDDVPTGTCIAIEVRDSEGVELLANAQRPRAPEDQSFILVDDGRGPGLALSVRALARLGDCASTGPLLGASEVVPASFPARGMSELRLRIVRSARAVTIAFADAPTQAHAGTCAGPFRVERRDLAGGAVLTGERDVLSVRAQPPALARLFGDRQCERATGEVVIGEGAASGEFMVRGEARGELELSVGDALGRWPDATHRVRLLPPSVGQLVVTSASQQVLAGACSAPLTFEARDATGARVTLGATETVSLRSSGAAVEFFGDPACTGAAVTELEMPVSGAALVRFRAARAGTFEVRLASDTLGSVAQANVVLPGPPAALVFLTPALTTRAGGCSAAVELGVLDALGNPTAPTSPIDLALTANPSFGVGVFEDPSCAKLLLAPKLSGPTTTLHVGALVAGPLELTASSSGLTPASQRHSITPIGSPALSFASATRRQFVGTCSEPVELELKNPAGSSPVIVTLATSPGTGLTFWSDAACTNTLTSLTLTPATTTRARFHVRALAPDTYTVTASSPAAASASQAVSVVGLSRRGPCTIPANAANITCDVAPPLTSVSRSLLVFGATSGSAAPTQAAVRCRLSSASQITCSRDSAVGDAVRVWWDALERPLGLSVQHLEPRCAGGPSSESRITPTDPSQAFVLFSSQARGTSFEASHTRTAALTDSETVSIRAGSNPCNVAEHALQVVQWSGARVDRGSAEVTGALGRVSGLPPIELARSFLVYSTRAAGDDNDPEESGARPCAQMVRGALTSPTEIIFSRGAATTDSRCQSGDLSVAWERIELPLGSRVQQVTPAVTPGATLTSVSISAVDPARTLVVGGGQWASGQASGEGDAIASVVGGMIATFSLTTPTLVSVQRGSADGSAMWTTYVIELPGP